MIRNYSVWQCDFGFRGALYHRLDCQVKLAHNSELFSPMTWLWFQRYFVSWTSVLGEVGTWFRTIQSNDVTSVEVLCITDLHARHMIQNYSVWWCDFGFRGALYHWLACQVIATVVDPGACRWCKTLLNMGCRVSAADPLSLLRMTVKFSYRWDLGTGSA